MKATKLMSLGLIGLTSLGLAVIANSADSEVKTQASVTLSTESKSGNQEGLEGEISGEHPIDKPPNAVSGWKLAVPSVLKFTGTGSILEDEGGVTKTVYNPQTTKKDYVSEGLKNANGTSF